MLASPTGAAALCTISISQTSLLEVDHTNKNVTMRCSFTTSGCPSEQPTSLWFRYGAQKTENLCVHGCGSDKFTESKHQAENQVSLTVSNLQVNDSAIYICGIAFPTSGDPRAKQTGNGTLLVVRGLLAESLIWDTVFCSLFNYMALPVGSDHERKLLN